MVVICHGNSTFDEAMMKQGTKGEPMFNKEFIDAPLSKSGEKECENASIKAGDLMPNL